VSLDELERQTRSQRIDPKLRTAGWQVVPFVSGRPLTDHGNRAAVTEFETETGPADYAPWDHNEALGVVDGKKVTLGPQGVLTQAERYSRGFTVNPVDYGDGFRVPFLYSTNGEVIWFHDVRDPLNRSRRGLRLPHARRSSKRSVTASGRCRSREAEGNEDKEVPL
jgi:type I restriction enzyme R subunit